MLHELFNMAIIFMISSFLENPKEKIKQFSKLKKNKLLPREHSYKDMFACAYLVMITIRCFEFSEQDFSKYMSFNDAQEFKII